MATLIFDGLVSFTIYCVQLSKDEVIELARVYACKHRFERVRIEDKAHDSITVIAIEKNQWD